MDENITKEFEIIADFVVFESPYKHIQLNCKNWMFSLARAIQFVRVQCGKRSLSLFHILMIGWIRTRRFSHSSNSNKGKHFSTNFAAVPFSYLGCLCSTSFISLSSLSFFCAFPFWFWLHFLSASCRVFLFFFISPKPSHLYMDFGGTGLNAAVSELQFLRVVFVFSF